MASNKTSPFSSLKVATLLNSGFECSLESGKRHPLGKYNSSISHVVKYLNKIIENNNIALQTKIYDSNQPNYETLIDALLNYMNCFMAHVDVMGGIINDFYPEKKEQEKIKKELQRSDGRNYVAMIINQVKHNGCTLNPASIVNPKNEAILGFFVEGYDDDSVGPFKVAHNKGDDIISINYFVRKVTADIFLIDALIATYIEKKVSFIKEGHYDENLLKVLGKINDLPLRFFDKEYKRHHLMYTMKNGMVSLEHIKFKKNMIMQGRISVSYTSDGVNRSFKLPLGAVT